MPKNSLTIYLDAPLIDRVKAAAKIEGRSVSNYLYRGITQMVGGPMVPTSVGDELADPYSTSGRQVDLEELIPKGKTSRSRRSAKRHR